MESIELELLIKKVTTQVISDMMLQTVGHATVKDIHVPKSKQMLVLIPDFVVDLHEFIKYLADKYKEYELVVGASGRIDESDLKQIKEIINLNEEASREKLTKMANKFDATYFVLPGIKQIESIVNGDDTGFIEKLIIYLVLHGKNAGIILDYNVRSMPSNSLTEKLGQLLDSIKSMGISIDLLEEQPVEECIVCNENGKRLITEKDIDVMCRNGINTIHIGRECIITPLARDRASELGLKIT